MNLKTSFLIGLDNGRMRSIAAPVVPIKEASTAPINKNKVFIEGFASISPVR